MAGTFGTIPAPVPMPNPYGDLSNVYPNLSGTNQKVSGDISSQLSGSLSSDTVQNILNSAATFGQTSGMPGSGLAKNIVPKDIGTTSQALEQQGIGNYNQTIPTVSGTQTVAPSLQADINANNSLWQSSPDPTQAAAYTQNLFQQYLNQLKGPASGTLSWAGPTGSGTGKESDPTTLSDFSRWMNSGLAG